MNVDMVSFTLQTTELSSAWTNIVAIEQRKYSKSFY